MSITKASKLLSPEEIAVRAGEQMPYIQLPVRRELFSARATRLRQLAPGHAMHDFLLFAAELAAVQHEVLQDYPAVTLPSLDDLTAAARAATAAASRHCTGTPRRSHCAALACRPATPLCE